MIPNSWGPFSTSFMQSSLFQSCFHTSLRSKFPPDWPVPLPGPYPPFPAIIHHYRPSIPPTCSSNFTLPNFSKIFSRHSQSLYKTYTWETLVSSIPIGFFHPNMGHHPYPPSSKVQPLPGSNIHALSGSNAHPCRSIFSVIFANMDSIFPGLRGELWMR